MEDRLTKVKAKIRKSIDGMSKHDANVSENWSTEYPSSKPLPDPPERERGASRQTVRQVDAFGPNQGVRGHNSKANDGSNPDPASSQHFIPELEFDKLNIEDPSETFHDAEDISAAIPDRKSSKKFHTDQRGAVVNTRDSAHTLSEEEAVKQKVKRNRRSLQTQASRETERVGTGHAPSKSLDTGHGNDVIDTQNLNHQPDPEAAVRRNPLSPQAQLPPGFDLTDTVDTSVTTTQAPAVTHEVVHWHTEEIMHEEITRDIHIDHHFNYIQQYKEVVIKPAVHFTIDENGEKVRIPTPDCWETPPGFTPTIDDENVRDEPQRQTGSNTLTSPYYETRTYTITERRA